MNAYRVRVAVFAAVICATGLWIVAGTPAVRAAGNGADVMYLTVKDFEAGLSYRDVQRHAPIGMVVNPCSYADKLEPTIDWNDGKGEQKPDTNWATVMFQKTTPVIQNGVYLFWDDAHKFGEPGTTTVTTRLVAHCLGDPPGDKTYVARFEVKVYARVPVTKVAFTEKGKEITTVKGHDSVDVSITLGAPAPPSGTWVKLETVPGGSLNSLPPFFFVHPGQTQAFVEDLETQKPTRDATLVVKASTVAEAKQTQNLVITP